MHVNESNTCTVKKKLLNVQYCPLIVLSVCIRQAVRASISTCTDLRLPPALYVIISSCHNLFYMM